MSGPDSGQSGQCTSGTEHCPSCDCELVHGTDRYNYEVLQCPGCAKWKRPVWDELRESSEGDF